MSGAQREIMALASRFAEATAAHALACAEFAHDRADYDPIPQLADELTAARDALRSAVEEVR